MRGDKPVEEQSPEQARQHPHGQEEAGPAADPSAYIRRKAAAGYDRVRVRMVGQSEAPGVEHGGEPQSWRRDVWDRRACASSIATSSGLSTSGSRSGVAISAMRSP